jgi:hypothetical protein
MFETGEPFDKFIKLHNFGSGSTLNIGIFPNPAVVKHANNKPIKYIIPFKS